MAFFVNGSERERGHQGNGNCLGSQNKGAQKACAGAPWQEGGEQEDPEEAGGEQWGWEGRSNFMGCTEVLILTLEVLHIV